MLHIYNSILTWSEPLTFTTHISVELGGLLQPFGQA